MLLFSIKKNIAENIALLHQLTNEEFTTRIPQLSDATIGEHMRHIIELFDCLLSNYNNGIINYDDRKRDIRIQSDVNFAISMLENQLDSIEKPNKELSLVHGCYSNEEPLTTNYYRELLYNLEHSIHHQALIKVALFGFKNIEISHSFGVAPSTIEYRKQCAQ